MNEQEIFTWFRKMGYTGDFPKTFNRIYNRQTTHIWEQLVQNVQSRTKVENIREKVIIKRLEQGLKENSLQYPLEEIILHQKKCNLKKKLAELEKAVENYKQIYSNLSRNRRTEQFCLEKVKLEIKDKKTREYLLKMKFDLLKKDTEIAEKLCNKHLEFIESSLSENIEEIEQMLKSSTEDLEKGMKIVSCDSINVSLDVTKTSNNEVNSITKDLNCSLLEEDLDVTVTAESTEKRADIENCCNQDILNNISHLLHNYKRETIGNVFHNHVEKLHGDFIKIITPVNKFQRNLEKEDFTDLYRMHICTEFKYRQKNIETQQLQTKVNTITESILGKIINSEFSTEKIKSLSKNLNLYIKNIQLEWELKAIQQLIEHYDEQNNCNEFLLYKTHKTTISNLKAENLKKILLLKHYITIIQTRLENIKHIRENTENCIVEKLMPLIANMDCRRFLNQDINTKDITTFKIFPLEYNRRFVNTDPNIYYKDMHTNQFLYYMDLCEENLYILVNLLKNPHAVPEKILKNIYQSMLKLEAMNSFCNKHSIICDFKKYTLQELIEKEDWVTDTRKKLQSMIFSKQSSETLSASNCTDEFMNIWIEMPFRNAISSDKLYEGKDYKYYEKRFDESV